MGKVCQRVQDATKRSVSGKRTTCSQSCSTSTASYLFKWICRMAFKLVEELRSEDGVDHVQKPLNHISPEKALRRWVHHKNRNNDWDTNFMTMRRIARASQEAARFYVSAHAERQAE